MIRFLQLFNCVGVLALAVLCAFQWRTNRQLNLQAIDLERTRQRQMVELLEKDKQIQGDAADLDDFRTRLTLSESELKELDVKLSKAIAEQNHLTIERDQLKGALEKWIAAVTARDMVIKQAGEQIQTLATERNDAVHKFNDLAEKYNAILKDMSKSATKP